MKTRTTINVLGRLRVRTKLILLLGLTILALILSIGASSVLMEERMMADRIDKLRAIVQSAIGVAEIINAVALGRSSTACGSIMVRVTSSCVEEP